MLTSLCRPQGRQRGLSIVEVLVGIAVGLVLITGVLNLFVSNITNSRRMLVEARINQDLRVAADLIARDLRRAGYWSNAISGTIAIGTGTTTTPNPYIGVTPVSGSTSTVTYNFARDTNNSLDNNEQFGFRLQGGAIQMKTDNTPTWQSVTDPNVMTVSTFSVTPSSDTLSKPVALGSTCNSGCNTTPPPDSPASATGSCPNPPLLYVRRFDILIQATSATDATVAREFRESVRVRNDQVTGACPS